MAFQNFLKNRKLLWALGSILVLLVLIRAIAPQIILKRINSSLATMSGPFCGNLEDFDLSLLRGAYRLEGLHLKQWNKARTECEAELLSLPKTEIFLAWGPLLHGDARLAVEVEGADLKASEFLEALGSTKTKAKEAQAGAQETVNHLIPWRIDSLRIRDSKLTYQLLGAKGITAPLDKVEADITGIGAKSDSGQPMLYRAKANVFNDAPLIVSGSVDPNGKDLRWDADFNLRNLDLVQANALLKDRLPMTFTTGRMALYGEAAGKGAGIDGYTRLFFSKIDVVSSKEKWGSFRRAVVELVSALFFIVTKNEEQKDVATELVFKGEIPNINIDWVGALTRTMQHKGGKLIPQGIDNRLELPKP